MANWSKLDEEFYSLMENLTSGDWENWALLRKQNKELRNASLQLKAKMHLSRINFLEASKGNSFIHQRGEKTFFSDIKKFALERIDGKKSGTDIAMAA